MLIEYEKPPGNPYGVGCRRYKAPFPRITIKIERALAQLRSLQLVLLVLKVFLCSLNPNVSWPGLSSVAKPHSQPMGHSLFPGGFGHWKQSSDPRW